VGDYLGVKL